MERKKIWNWGKLLEKKNLLFALGLAGILLIGLSDLFTRSEKKAAAPTAAYSASDSEQALETRLAKLLADVAGAGKVNVMVTLENTGETVYAQNVERQTQEQTADSGTQRRTEQKSEHILYDGDGGKQALVETRLEPEVKGVAVLCEGGDDILVIKRITDLVATVLDIPTNRICVAKMI